MVMKPQDGDMSIHTEYFSQYIGSKVIVHYPSAYTDNGTLEYISPFWVELIKEGGERLLIPTAAIRLIKLIDSIPQNKESKTLLRPAEKIKE